MSARDEELLQDLISAGPTGPQHQPVKTQYPNGWQPRAEVDDVDGGVVVTMPRPFVDTAPASHGELLSDFGLKSEDWSVERVRVSRWQSVSGAWLESKRLSLLPARAAQASRVDMEELGQLITRWRPSLTVKDGQREGSFFDPRGDYQLGKIGFAGNRQVGSKEIVEQSLSELENSLQRFILLDKRHHFEQVVLPQVGDCIEGVSSQGGALIKRTDLGLTEMVRVYRRLLWAQIKAYSSYAPRTLVPAVGGNHDQAIRIANQDGSWGTDSWAIDAASAVRDQVNENPELRDRVSFIFPERDKLTVAFDASNTTVGLAHGHQFRGGWAKWWSGQSSGRTGVGDADVLIAGHLHHLHVQDHGQGRVFVQIPAMDTGSEWFEGQTGERSRSRTVTFWVLNGRVYDLDPVT